MAQSRTLLAALAAILIGGFAGTADADDFIFEVPVQLSNVAPDAESVEVAVFCWVSAVVGSTASRDLIAQQRAVYSFFPESGPIVGPVTDTRLVTIRMNATRIRPASEARYWACELLVNASYDGTLYAIGHNEDPGVAEIYQRVTHHRLVRAVTRISGEIAAGP
jgi:hypothetical protein